MKKSAYDGIRLHGEQTYPYECCGVLLGRPDSPGSADLEGWSVDRAVRAGNIRTDSPRDRYEIASAELVRILGEARQQGLEIAGFYHSHPDHPAMWSETDLAEAHWLGCSYLITEVAHGRAAATSSFLLAGKKEEDKHFVQERIDLVD